MSTKKVNHGSISTKNTATKSSKHSLQENAKIKIKKKPTDLESEDTSKIISLNKSKISRSTPDKKNNSQITKTKSEISNTLRKSGITSMTATKATTDKKKKVLTNHSNIKKPQKTIESDKTIPKNVTSTSSKTNTIQVSNKHSTNNIKVDEDTSHILERPSTATLSKGTVSNDNKIGPDVLNSDSVKSSSPKSESSEDQDKYEDDFESYESDFEEYSSSSSTNLINSSSLSSYSEEPTSFEKKIISSGSEDDKTLDSGHFEMPGYKHKPMLDNIKEAIEKENNLSTSTNYASFSDEGFEDHKSFQFVNFVDAQIKNKRRKSIELRQKRGEEILSMVRLDYFSFTLLDLAPISYDMYLRNTNAIQTSTQTGDDDVDEEIQTDEIDNLEKGTQQPEVFISFNLDNDNDRKSVQKPVNKNVLNKFLLSAFEVVLKIQEESNIKRYDIPNTGPFSKAVATFKTDTDIFVDTYVSHILFPSEISDKVITIHCRREESLVVKWNLFNPEQPELIYLCYGIVTCICFGVIKNELIFTGLEDGAILVWNIRSNLSKIDCITCVPLFSSAINSGHNTKIIGLYFLGNSSIKDWNIQQTNELCSIDEVGEIILWTIVSKYSEGGDNDSNNKMALVKNATILLNTFCPYLNDLHFTNFCSSIYNPYYLFLSTNYDSVIHYVIKAGINKVTHFSTEIRSIPKSLECCPFSSDYFLAGYDNGNISLFSRSSEKPLIILSEKDKTQNSAIELIQWSKNKSTVIYSKDDKNNINIWDLDESDMTPIYTIPYKEQITSMKISSAIKNTEHNNSFMLIGTNQGNLFLHHLNEGHGQPGNELYNQSIKTFFNYVKRL